MIQNKNIDINHHVQGQRPRCPQTMNDISAWWSLKVICGLLLVANQAAYFAFGLPAPIFSIPIALSQVLVISGAVIFFTHFTILKRANPLLNRPGRLVQNKGLFRWIRHPMYMGEMLLDLGLASFWSSSAARPCSPHHSPRMQYLACSSELHSPVTGLPQTNSVAHLAAGIPHGRCSHYPTVRGGSGRASQIRSALTQSCGGSNPGRVVVPPCP